MKITIHPTTEVLFDMFGAPRARIWEGTTENGRAVFVVVEGFALQGGDELSDAEIGSPEPPSREALAAFFPEINVVGGRQ